MTRYKLLIRCDGAPAIGFGHVVRCLALADVMCAYHGWQVEFAMMTGEIGFAQVREKSYVVHCAPGEDLSGEEEGIWLRKLVQKTQPQVLVLDVRTHLMTSTIQSLRKRGVLIVTIDDPSERRLVADLAFYPPVPQVEKMDWTGFTGKRCVGWEWVLLRPEFARAREKKLQEIPRSGNSPPRILVTMGGSDPAGFTLLVLKALDTLQQDFRVCVVLGAGFMHDNELNEWLKTAHRTYTIKRNVADIAKVMSEADISIASFGVTAYELAAVGVPAILLSLSDDHACSGQALHQAGMAVSLGNHADVTEGQLADAIHNLLGDSEARRTMRAACVFIDGKGADRISDRLNEALSASEQQIKHQRSGK